MQHTQPSDPAWQLDLKSATRDLHEQCHAHPFARRMFQSKTTPQEWADWLTAFYVIHEQADRELPSQMARKWALLDDLSRLPGSEVSPAALTFADKLAVAETTLGAAYVLHGAHSMGGKIIAERMKGGALPCSHVVYANPEQAQRWVDQLRDRADLTGQAQDTFRTMLAVMDEIDGR